MVLPQRPRKERGRIVNPVSVFVVVFLGLWVSLLFWAQHYSSVPNQPESVPNNNVDRAEKPKSLLSQEAVERVNAWYGWQPKIAPTMECSWVECFQDNHRCRTCRDEDLGPAPPVPVGWVPDVTMLHQMYLEGTDKDGNPWPPPLGGDICDSFGYPDTNKQLIEAVPITVQSKRETPKLFCGVYTMEAAHSKTIRAMRETWAPRCDGFLAFSTTSDPRIPAMAIQHEGEENYNNMWQKSRAIWKFIGDHYLNDFDYFFIGGEDLFVIPDNLRAYLATLSSPEDDHFVGRRFKSDVYFNSGGAGYALSRGALRKYVTVGYEHDSCSPHRHTAMEDVMIANCLKEAFGIGITDTRDSEGRERFHPFAPGTHLTWEHPAPGRQDWYEDYNQEWGLKLGKDCCAPDSVSFHYIKMAPRVRQLFALIHYCNKR